MKKNKEDAAQNLKHKKIQKVQFTNKEKYYYRVINKYFRQTDFHNIEQMIDIIKKDSKIKNSKISKIKDSKIKDSKISLRLLDWFVTSYACNNMVCYNIPDDEDIFIVHISYKAQLKSYKKRYFDPFRRGKRFAYSYDRKDRSKRLVTTLGQLNFFKWAFTYNIIEYVSNNYDDINKQMIATNKANKENKKKKRNEELSLSQTHESPKKRHTVRVKKKNIEIEAEQNIDNDKIALTVSFV